MAPPAVDSAEGASCPSIPGLGSCAEATATERESLGEPWFRSNWVTIDLVPHSDEEALQLHYDQQRPMVLRGGSIVPIEGWEELAALSTTLAKTKVTVKHSRKQNVAYFRDDKNTGGHPFKGDTFVREVRTSFPDFLVQADAAKDRRAVGAQVDVDGDENHLYCQETFTGHPELDKEFGRWNWGWVLRQCQKYNWGLPETNVLFMGTEGASTPAHFDEQHNFLNQVRGRKLVVLFPPQDYSRMYPFPVTHPCDRCSLVDVTNPDLERFPRFAEAQGHHFMLEPGDILYIPYGWWHFCRTATHLGASITFWAQANNNEVPASLGPLEWTRARRNLEKLLASDVGAPRLGEEVKKLLDCIDNSELDNARLVAMRKMLGMLQIPEADQLGFLADTFRNRFGFDPDQCV